MPLAKRLRATIGTIMLLVVLVLVGIVTVTLVRGTWMVTPVLSGSMRPGFSVGGVVISERVPVSSLAVRDVIVFQRPDRPSEQVVHRIVQLTDGGSGQLRINTQGDANTVRDPWTLTIRGSSAYRVRWSLPLLGYVAVAFQDHRGQTLLIAGLILIAIAVFTLRASHSRDGRSGEEEQGSDGPGDTGLPAGEGVLHGSELSELDFPSAPWSAARPSDQRRPPPVPVPSLDFDVVH